MSSFLSSQPMSTFKGNSSSTGIYHHKQSSQYFHHNHPHLMSLNNHASGSEDELPPPLPPKKRNITAYMQMMGSYCGPNDVAFNLYRRSVHSYHSVNNISNNQNSIICPSSTWRQQLESSLQHQCSLHQSFTSISTSSTSTLCGSKDSIQSYNSSQSESPSASFNTTTSVVNTAQLNHLNTSSFSSEPSQYNRNFITHSSTCSAGNSTPSNTNAAKINCKVLINTTLNSVNNQNELQQSSLLPPSLPPKRRPIPVLPPIIRKSITPQTQVQPELSIATINNINLDITSPISEIDSSNNSDNTEQQQQSQEPPEKIRPSSPVGQAPSSESGISSQSESIRTDVGDLDLSAYNILDEMDVSSYLIYKTAGDDGPEIRGGPVDALIVKATEVPKNDFLFQEAFLTTYRTFISPMELITKLLFRYNKFINFTNNDVKQRSAKNAFILLVRVVDDLCINECSDTLMQNLLEFIYQLENKGDVALARVLRVKVIEKLDARRNCQNTTQILLPLVGLTTKTWTLHDFKSSIIAEQMTLLDAGLFQKIEVAEYLLWAREQKQELIPNLNKFTEHFNNMSYWARSRLVELEDAKERERLALKFIKIMKHLRKINNFNSFLALLSALDSGPIRRLAWPKSITETLKDFCSLIDSSSSFRTYRQVLADTQPPCIPYIGLILQDLTFVHVGNSDFLQDSYGNNVNFAKRWQIFNILDQMRRFRYSHYPFRKHEQVLSYFDNFDNYLSEEAIWQMSEAMKPRGVPNTKK